MFAMTTTIASHENIVISKLTLFFHKTKVKSSMNYKKIVVYPSRKLELRPLPSNLILIVCLRNFENYFPIKLRSFNLFLFSETYLQSI